MILVIGLNPAVDAEWRVDHIQWDEKNNVLHERRWPGGKPVNVARWLQHLRQSNELLMPLGGGTGREMAADIHALGIKLIRVPIQESTRVNVMVTQSDGPQLRFNPLGPKLSREEWTRLFAAVQKANRKSRLTIFSGSLPRAAAVGTYRRMIEEAHHAGVNSILDCDGRSLREGIKAKPFLVKPNRFELAQWCGSELRSTKAIITAAKSLSDATGGWVLVSLDADGGMLLNALEGFQAQAEVPFVKAKNTVGAGDAVLAMAASCITAEKRPEDWLRHGMAAGCAFVQMPAGVLPSRSKIAQFAKLVKVRNCG